MSRDRWQELGYAIDSSSGAMQQMADTQLDNLEGDITKFQSALEGAQITLADQLNPALRELVQSGTQALGELVNAVDWEELGNQVKDFIAAIDIKDLMERIDFSLVAETIGKLVANLLELGETAGPVIGDVIDIINRLLEFFNNLDPSARKALVGVLAFIVGAKGAINTFSGISSAISGVNKIAGVFTGGAGDKVYATFLKWSVIILAVTAALTALIAMINVLVGKGDEVTSAMKSVNGSMGGGSFGGGASRPRMVRSMVASGDGFEGGEEGNSLTASTYSLTPSGASRAAAVRSMTASALSREAAIQSLERSMPNIEARTALATAGMAPSGAYAALPLSSGGNGPGDSGQAPIILRPNLTLKVEGDMRQLFRVLKVGIEEEDIRMGHNLA